ncbi:MAG: aldehyde ferredoxin oxidoreductase C-terminal domain-containing protein [Candidatus Baldrarchaeia archaeon]
MPRGAKGQALSYATSNRGGCHLRGYTIKREIYALFEYPDRLSEENRAKLVVYSQNLKAAVDSMIVCEFITYVFELPHLAEVLGAVTGWDITWKELLKIGERIYNAERIFNVKSFGDCKEYDTLPKRFLEEPIPRGLLKGQVVHLDRMLGEYYELRGWKDGRPTRSKVRELGLEKYTKDIKLPE